MEGCDEPLFVQVMGDDGVMREASKVDGSSS